MNDANFPNSVKIRTLLTFHHLKFQISTIKFFNKFRHGEQKLLSVGWRTNNFDVCTYDCLWLWPGCCERVKNFENILFFYANLEIWIIAQIALSVSSSKKYFSSLHTSKNQLTGLKIRTLSRIFHFYFKIWQFFVFEALPSFKSFDILELFFRKNGKTSENRT